MSQRRAITTILALLGTLPWLAGCPGEGVLPDDPAHAASALVTDQDSGIEADGSAHCARVPGTLQQSFRPEQSLLAAVELSLVRRHRSVSLTRSQLRIHRAAGAGQPAEVLAVARARTDTATRAGDPGTTVFELDEELALLPGGRYLLEWVPPADGSLAWHARVSGRGILTLPRPMRIDCV